MDIEYIARCFDESSKVRFRDVESPQYIKFGSAKDNDVRANIRFGQLKLPGKIVAECFQPSIDCIVEAVKGQVQAKPDQFKVRTMTLFTPVPDLNDAAKSVILVGGFSSSHWLFNRVRDELGQIGLDVVRAEHDA